MTKHPLLRKYLLENFAAEVEELKDAVFVGLGPQAQKVLERLIQERVLKPDRVIGGMLHPSSNCTYRIKYLIGDRSAPGPARHQPCALRPGPASISGAVRHRLIESRVSGCGRGFNSANGNRTGVLSDALG